MPGFQKNSYARSKNYSESCQLELVGEGAAAEAPSSKSVVGPLSLAVEVSFSISFLPPCKQHLSFNFGKMKGV